MALGTHLLDHPLHEAHVVEHGHDTAEEDDNGQNLSGESTGPGVRGRKPAGYPGPRRPQTAHLIQGLATRTPDRVEEQGPNSVPEVTNGASLEAPRSSPLPTGLAVSPCPLPPTEEACAVVGKQDSSPALFIPSSVKWG